MKGQGSSLKPNEHAAKLAAEREAVKQNTMKRVYSTGIASRQDSHGNTIFHGPGGPTPTPRQSGAGLPQEFTKIHNKRPFGPRPGSQNKRS